MRIRWSPEAANDLEEIFDYLLLHRPAFAQSTVIYIYKRLTALRRFPMSGRISAYREGYRELVLVPLPYVCTYRVDVHAVYILQIRHGAQEQIQEPPQS